MSPYASQKEQGFEYWVESDFEGRTDRIFFVLDGAEEEYAKCKGLNTVMFDTSFGTNCYVLAPAEDADGDAGDESASGDEDDASAEPSMPPLPPADLGIGDVATSGSKRPLDPEPSEL